MAENRRPRLILIVVGSSLRAEEADRPLAYYLKKQIEEAIGRLDPERDAGIHVVVMADFRWLHDEPMQKWPTISLGGPGVNALTHRWLETLPISLAVDEHYYVQMDPQLKNLHASIWGMDNSETQIAVSAFIQRFVESFLQRCAEIDPDAIADEIHEEEEEEDDDDDVGDEEEDENEG